MLSGSKHPFRPGLKRFVIFDPVSARNGLVSKFSPAGVNSTRESRLFVASRFQTEIRQKLNVIVGYVGQRLGGGSSISGGHIRHAVMSYPFLHINWIDV